MTPEVTTALRILYGEDVPDSPGFLKSLDAGNLKSIFRQRAMELHPDRAAILGKSPVEMSEAFKDVKLAYDLLLDLLGPSLEKTVYTHRHPFTGGVRLESPGAGDHYWEADIPEVDLLFGQFLYYAGLITFNSLVSAITWQRRQRPSFGRIARMWGYLSDDQIRDVLSSRTRVERIGDAAVRMGFLKGFQRNTVLGFQRYLQRPIGEFFREAGVLTEDEISYLVGLLKKHNRTVRRMGQV